MSTDMMQVGLLTMLFFSTCVARMQDASESAPKGAVQMEFATTDESYFEGEIKSNIKALFSGVI